MILRRIAHVTVMAMALLGPALARAGTGMVTVAIDYHAPPACPDGVDFKAIVSNRLGYDAFLPEAQDHVQITVLPQGHSFEGSIEWRTAGGEWAGERKFPSRSGDCHELMRAMAFALALQIQFSSVTGQRPGAEAEAAPDAALIAVSPEGSSSAAPRVQESRQPFEEVVEAPAPKRPGGFPWPKIGLGAGAAAGFGLSSKIVPLTRLFASAGWSYLGFELGGEAGWPTITRREDGAGFSQRFLLASVAVCGGELSSLSACLLAKVGQIRIAGRDIDLPESTSGPIFETGLRLAFTQALGWRLFATAHATGLLNVTRWRVELDELDVWSSSRVAATLGLDLGVSLP